MYAYQKHQFIQEVSIVYRGEIYSVRDNGSIFRQRRNDYRKRPLDEQWTFGTPCERDGYMKICSTAVHRIVTTAFHGEQPGPEYVVDHIDTNRRNNRPENLRWVTRLENILQNPKTLRRIKSKWGSVEGLLNDPNPSERTDPLSNRPWMHNHVVEEIVKDEITESLTYLAVQRNWRTPSEFPLCPDEISDYPLYDYASRLVPGSAFSRNKYGDSLVEAYEISPDGSCISVICCVMNGVKDWAVAKVRYENGQFIHESCGTFFEHVGAVKEHCKLIGKPCADLGESIDDYC